MSGGGVVCLKGKATAGTRDRLVHPAIVETTGTAGIVVESRTMYNRIRVPSTAQRCVAVPRYGIGVRSVGMWAYKKCTSSVTLTNKNQSECWSRYGRHRENTTPKQRENAEWNQPTVQNAQT